MASKVRTLSPSQKWLGNSGPWSTYAINVGGDSPQTVFVLPSTSGRSTWVVLSGGCGAPGDPSTCADDRGQLFSLNKSTTARPIGDPSEAHALDFDTEAPLTSALPADLDYTGNALTFTDQLAFGFDSNDAPVLENQFIAGFETKLPFLGQLGLSAFNETVLNYTDIHPSVIGALYQSGDIPSRSWGYTAGAKYRNDFGALTLGGFDSSRASGDNVLTVPMANSNRTLTLQLKKTSVSSGKDKGADETSYPVFIDSVVPELWLPESIYSVFEETLGVSWNSLVNMYFVDDARHEQLLKNSASVTFSLAANDSNAADTIDITLPYAALNLNATFPLLEGIGLDATATRRYFPVRRAKDPSQYYFGRTFLQEAYIAADYDRGVFHVSQAVGSTAAHSSGNGLSGGAIAGIVVGVIAVLAIAGGLLWRFCWRKRKGKKRERRSTLGTSSIGDNTTIAEWNNEVQMQQVEQYKPAEISGEELDRFKPELDATVTARGVPNERHELWGGSVRRASDQSRASISPLEERHRMSRFSHNRTISSNSFGQPSPPMSDHPSPPLASSGRDSPFGQPSPQQGARTPAAVDQDRSWFGGMQVYHELHGRSRDSPRSPTSPVEAPEEVPLSSQPMLSTPERETRRSGFVEEFDLRSQPESRP